MNSRHPHIQHASVIDRRFVDGPEMMDSRIDKVRQQGGNFMKKRIKLLTLPAAALVAATVATAPAFADNANSFVTVAWKRTAGGSTDVTISEYDNHSQQLRSTSYNAEHEAHFWKIDDTYRDAKGDVEQVFLVRVSGGHHTWNVYPGGIPDNAKTDPSAISGLPACFRVSLTGYLHHADGTCDTHGASELTWP
jgi:hypothetical protein